MMKRTLAAALAALMLGCSGQLSRPSVPTPMGGRPVVLVIADIEGDVGEKTRAELMSQLAQLDDELGGTPFGTRDSGLPLRCWRSPDPATLIARCDAEAQSLGTLLHADAVIWGRVVGKNSGLFQLYWSLPDEMARTFHPAHGERQQLSWADFAPLLGDVLIARASRGGALDSVELARFGGRMERALGEGSVHGFSPRVRGEIGLLHGDTLLALAVERSRDPGGGDAAIVAFERARAAYRRALDAFKFGAAPDLRAAAQAALARAAEALARLKGDAAAYREAIDAYDAAAKTHDRRTEPLAWQAAETHAANLELELGQRLGDTRLMRRSVMRNREMVGRHSPDEAAARNNLCAAMTTLGAALSRTDDLESAVKACRDANAVNRDEQPLLWAAARRNLGNALSALAQVKTGGDELERAIEAYTDARTTYAANKQQLDWADVCLALGSAQASLGALKNDSARFEAALGAFAEAETVHSRRGDPETWSLIEANRAETLYLLGKLQNDDATLRRAASVLEGLAKATPRATHPQEWARVQHNLGSVLGSLGERTGAPDVLRRALGALRRALEVRTREATRDEWAASELALGQYAHALGQLSGDTQAHLEAVTALRAALTVYAEDPKSIGWAKASIALASSLAALGTKPEAEEAAALAAHVADATRSTLPDACADAQLVLGEALRAQLPDKPQRNAATTELSCRALSAYLSGWAVAVDHSPDQGLAGAIRIRSLLERTRTGRDCKGLPVDALARFQREMPASK